MITIVFGINSNFAKVPNITRRCIFIFRRVVNWFILAPHVAKLLQLDHPQFIISFMTKEQFKKRWESGDDGGGITFDDIANCAKEWGLYSTPRIKPMGEVTYKVLKTANVKDAEDYK